MAPSLVIVDKSIGKSMTTTTIKDNIYAFFFDQKGFMAGLGLKAFNITLIKPKEGDAITKSPALRSQTH